MARTFVSGSSHWLSDTSGAPVSGEPLTIAAWFWPIGDVTNALVSVGVSGNNNNRWTINSQNNAAGNNVTAQARSTFNGIATSSTSFTRNSGWYHACGVFTSITSRTVYLNGGGKVTDTTSLTPLGANSIYVGANMGLSANGFDGRVAEVGVWNVALTDQEVLILARGVCPLLVRPTALVGYYPIWGASSPEPNLGVLGHTALTVNSSPAQSDHAPVSRPFGRESGWVPYVVTGGTPVVATPGAVALSLSMLAPTPKVVALPSAVALTETLPAPRPKVVTKPSAVALLETLLAPRPVVTTKPSAIAMSLTALAPSSRLTAHTAAVATSLTLPAARPQLITHPSAIATTLTALAPRARLAALAQAVSLALTLPAPRPQYATHPGAVALTLTPLAPRPKVVTHPIAIPLAVTVPPPSGGSGPVIASPGAISLTLSVLGPRAKVAALPGAVSLTATLPQPRAVVKALSGSVALALVTQAAHPKVVTLPGAVALVAALPAPHIAVTAHPDVIALVIAVLPAQAGGVVPDVRGSVTGYTVLVYGAGGGTAQVGGVGGFTAGLGDVDGGTA